MPYQPRAPLFCRRGVLAPSKELAMFFRRKTPPATGEPISVVSAADDNYAMPLAVTIRSAIDHLGPGQRLNVYILDGGLSSATRHRLLQSWQAPHVATKFLQPPVEQVADLKTENHLNLVTYLRLFMPQLLPAELERVIFLDADLLVQKDLAELWAVELGDAPVAAINDYFTPYLNTREAIGRPSICDSVPEKCLPVRNYRELGLQGTAGYFNAGVMVVNLREWRRRDVLRQATTLVRRYWEHVLYCDQYALNVLFSEQWLPLDPRWNQNSNLWAWRDAGQGAFEPKLFRKLRSDPWIVHFTWTTKPWHAGCTHPYTRKFFRWVDRTDWRGWRPPRSLRQRAGDAYKQYRAWYRRTVAPVLRPVKDALRGKKRAA
jgi:lipopolysaccharide biosynthesis glycosyltransferase